MFKNAFAFLQKIGKSLMLPVSVLPVAGLLLGFGASNFSFLPEVVSHLMAAGGGAIFGNLALIFAIGVALGLTENDGVAAIAAVVGYVVLLATMGVMAPVLGSEPAMVMGMKAMETGVFGGIIAGALAAGLFNKYYRIELPPYLGFFAGSKVLGTDLKNSVGIEREGYFDLGLTASRGPDTFKVKLTKEPIRAAFGQFRFALINRDGNRGLVVRGGGEYLLLFYRNRSVSLDKAGQTAPHGFQPKRKGCHIDEEHFGF